MAIFDDGFSLPSQYSACQHLCHSVFKLLHMLAVIEETADYKVQLQSNEGHTLLTLNQ